jgi:hypothetical protein
MGHANKQLSPLTLLESYLKVFADSAAQPAVSGQFLRDLIALLNAAEIGVIGKLFHREGAFSGHAAGALVQAISSNDDAIRFVSARGLMNLSLIVKSSSSLAIQQASEKIGRIALKELKAKAIPGSEMKMAEQQFERPQHAIEPKEKLKIAICVSGQLRGYKKAWRTVKRLGLHVHDCDVFVHTWANVGRKLPTGSHAARIFSGNILTAFSRVESVLGIDKMQQAYPKLFDLVAEAPPVEAEELKEFFSAVKVVVEDDTAEVFKAMTNQEKMLYKIGACFDLAMEHSDEYDLVIRMRPDRGFKLPAEPISWPSILASSHSNRIIFANGYGSWVNGTGYKVADQFAVGETSLMKAYCNAHEIYTHPPITTAFRWLDSEGFGQIGFSLFVNGVNAYPVTQYTNIQMGKITEYDLPAEEDVFESIRADINDRQERLTTDAKFEEAIASYASSANVIH